MTKSAVIVFLKMLQIIVGIEESVFLQKCILKVIIMPM